MFSNSIDHCLLVSVGYFMFSTTGIDYVFTSIGSMVMFTCISWLVPV